MQTEVQVEWKLSIIYESVHYKTQSKWQSADNYYRSAIQIALHVAQCD